MTFLDIIVLWIHTVSAILFIGGSFFMWLVLVPASYEFSSEEAKRTLIVGKVAKRFAWLVNPLLAIMVLTGLYNATWYLPSIAALFDTARGRILLAKSCLVALLLASVYFNGLYYGRRMVNLARENRVEELRKVRRVSKVVSYANLFLMLAIVLFAIMLQMPL